MYDMINISVESYKKMMSSFLLIYLDKLKSSVKIK